MRLTSKLARGAALAALLFLTGCVDKTVSGDTATFSFAFWAIALVFVIGLAAAPLGWMMRRTSMRFTIIGIIAAPVLLVIFLPGLIMHKVKVDSNHFEGRSGIWISPTVFNIRYADLDHIDVVTYETRGRRGRITTKQRLEIVSKRGGTTTLQADDLMKQAGQEIIKRANAAGVRVQDRNEHL
jgi:hypothetical protein